MHMNNLNLNIGLLKNSPSTFFYQPEQQSSGLLLSWFPSLHYSCVIVVGNFYVSGIHHSICSAHQWVIVSLPPASVGEKDQCVILSPPSSLSSLCQSKLLFHVRFFPFGTVFIL